jgi:uracil-DNA glycosylase family 4
MADGTTVESLARLQAEMRACRRCLEAGYLIAPGAVFQGRADAQVMLIGQAPGITEAEVKRPFNAGSGRRLFQWLEAAGWAEADFRARHYMTAVTKCYPGRSQTGKGDRVPSKTEQALCRSFLERELSLVRPRLLILVGGLAIKLLYPAKTRLDSLIGTAVYFPPQALHHPLAFDLNQAEQLAGFVATKAENGRWVVPLPHPSGASLWPNKAENQALLQRAITILQDIRHNLGL